MNNTINNTSINFQAKMSLADDLAKNIRLQKISKAFEEKTAKRYPQYELQLRRPDDLSQDKLEIAIDRGVNDDLVLREHVLTPNATEKFMKLSDNKIIQKLTKLLSIVKKRDTYQDNIGHDIGKLESKYGELEQLTYEAILEDTEQNLKAKNLEKLSKDPILSDYTDSWNILS